MYEGPASKNLGTFRILWLVKGILTILVSFVPLIYLLIGGVFLHSQEFANDPKLPFNLGYVFVVIGLVGFILIFLFGIVTLLTAKYIKEQRNYSFIYIISILNCLTGVLGILLGVFTIIEISKPEVKDLFEKKQQPAAY